MAGGGAGGANPCANGIKDGAETDVDCGGSGTTVSARRGQGLRG